MSGVLKRVGPYIGWWWEEGDAWYGMDYARVNGGWEVMEWEGEMVVMVEELEEVVRTKGEAVVRGMVGDVTVMEWRSEWRW